MSRTRWCLRIFLTAVAFGLFAVSVASSFHLYSDPVPVSPPVIDEVPVNLPVVESDTPIIVRPETKKFTNCCGGGGG